MEKDNLANRFLSGVAWSALFRIGGILSTVMINVLLARMVSPADLGLYFLIFSVAMFLSIIARFGMKQTVVKIVAEALAKQDIGAASDAIKKVLFVALTGIAVIGSLLKMGLGQWISINLFHSEQMALYVSFLIMWMAALTLLLPISEAFRGLHKVSWAAALDSSASNMLLVLLLTVLLFIKESVNLQDVLTLAVIAYSTFVLIGFVWLRANVKSSHRGAVSYRYIFSVSAPVFLINISTYIVANSSLWVVGYFLSPFEVGIYGTVLKIFNLIALPLLITNMAIDPIIMKLHVASHKERLQELIQLSATLAFLVTFVLTMILIFYGKSLLGFAFGVEFVAGYSVLVILVFGNLVNVWTGSCNNYLIMTGKQSLMMYITVISGILSVLLSIILVQMHGMKGVAVAVAFSVALRNVLAWGYLYRAKGVRTNASPDVKRMFSLLWGGNTSA